MGKPRRRNFMAIHKLYTKNRKIKQLNNYPASIRIWPDILVSAVKNNAGGAARLWMIAKHINPGGCGVIPGKSLRHYALKGLGIKRAKYDAWLDRATMTGLLSRRDENIRITGIAQAAALLGVARIRRPVYQDIGALVRQGWFAQVWAAWLACHGFTDRPISRAKLRELSGVSERNQRDLERRADVVNLPNYAIDDSLPADNLAGIRDFHHPGAFKYKNVTAWRLPNSREIKNINQAAKGSTRRTNKRLAALHYGLVEKVGRDLVRLYCKKDQQLKSTTKKIRKLDSKGRGNLPEILYLFDKKASKSRGFGIYAAITA